MTTTLKGIPLLLLFCFFFRVYWINCYVALAEVAPSMCPCACPGKEKEKNQQFNPFFF